jgi:hypothetical protein
MDRLARSVLIGLAVAGISVAAQAGASAFVEVNGIPFANLNVTGAAFNGGILGGASLAPGESRTFSYDYVITVQEDGLASTRTDTLCAEFDGGGAGFGGVRCISPTGFDVAAAGLTLGNVNARGSNPFFAVTGFTIVELRVDGPAPSFESQSGTAEITVTNLDTLFPHAGTFGFSVYALVDSVPEPETYALYVAGLGLLSWRGRRLVALRKAQ